MKKIHYDINDVDGDSAKIIGIYDDAVHDTIPSPVVEVDEATWGDIINVPSDHRRVDVNMLTIVEYTPAPNSVSNTNVNRERDRRISLGANVTISNGASFMVSTNDIKDFRNIQALVTLAQIENAEGNSSPITFRDAGNVDRSLLPNTMISVGKQVTKHVDNHYKAAWALKDSQPIVNNYIANTHWP